VPYRSLQYLNKTYLPTVKWTEVWVYDSRTFLNFTQMTQMILFRDSQWLDWYNWYDIVNQYNSGPRLIIISQAIGEERIMKFFSSG